MERLAEFAVCGAFCNTLLPSGYILASIQRLGDADCVGRNLVKQGFPLRVVRAFEAMHPATSKMNTSNGIMTGRLVSFVMSQRYDSDRDLDIYLSARVPKAQ